MSPNLFMLFVLVGVFCFMAWYASGRSPSVDKKPWLSGVEHDYRQQQRCWGHNFSSVSGSRWIGHGLGLNVGDVVLVDMQRGDVGVWRISEIHYYRDPPDMWTATVELVERRKL